VANEALPQAPDGNAEWLAARMDLPAAIERRHYVATDAGGAPVAYGAIERDSPEKRRWRLFIVAREDDLRGDAGRDLWDRLWGELRIAGAERVWMREQADDAALIRFARDHGFAETARFDVDGLAIVTMERALNG
jgi:hypothetical protein